MKNVGILVPILASAALFALNEVNVPKANLSSDVAELNRNRRLFVDPSSTSLLLGKASLIVSPLEYRDNTYADDYQLKVVPYFFMSQKGPLLLAAPLDSYRRLMEGAAVEFTGMATNEKDGKTKVVTGKITPLTRNGGKVSFSILTDNGTMVFDTLYHFAP